MEKKKVLMLSSAEYTSSTRFTRIAKILKKNDYNIDIVCCDRSNKFPSWFDLEGIKIYFIKSFMSKLPLNYITMPLFLFILYLKILFKVIKKKIDIVYCYTFDMQIISIILKKLFKIKLIYDSAEYYPGMIRDRVPNILFSIIRTLYYKFARNADFVLCTNIWTKYQFKLANISNVKVFSNVPDLTKFHFDIKKRLLTRKSLNLNDDIVLFSFIGFLAKYRGLEEIVEACNLIKEEIRNFKILIIGRGPIKEKILNLIKIYNLSNFFIILNFINFDKVPNYVNASDVIFVFYNPDRLNNWYAVPNKLFEALACKIPVIGSDFGYLKKLIQEMNCGLLVNPKNIEDICNKMKILIKDPILRSDLGEEGVKYIEKKYNLNYYSKILLDIFEKLK